MSDTLDLLTLAEAKTALNMSGSTHDTELALWITGVSRRVDALCGPVVQRTVTGETHDGGCEWILLRKTPVLSVTTVTEYDDTTATVLAAESNASKTDDDYLLENDGLRVLLRRRASNADTSFPAGRRNVVVTYEAGRYAATASVDERFKQAAGAAMRRLWQREQGAWATGGDPFDTSGAGTSGFFKVVDPVVTELLSDQMLPPGVG